MGSFKLKDNLFDPFRYSVVAATPEELVRQNLLKVMTLQLGYPKELLVVEKQLSELPHLLDHPSLPKRRVDIVCFAKDIHPEHPFYPLLLIECKEGKISPAAKEQALGYNHFIGAFFVAVAGEEGQVELIYPQTTLFLPHYFQLRERVACL